LLVVAGARERETEADRADDERDQPDRGAYEQRGDRCERERDGCSPGFKVSHRQVHGGRDGEGVVDGDYPAPIDVRRLNSGVGSGGDHDSAAAIG
jgi:hypothetical protein